MLKLKVAFLAAPMIFAATAVFASDPIALVATSSLNDRSITLRSTNEVIIPYGRSVSPAFSVPALEFVGNRIQVSLEGPTCSGRVTDVFYTSSPNQNHWQIMARGAGDNFLYQPRHLYLLQFNVTQTQYRDAQCQYVLTISAGAGSDHNDNAEVYAGVINYTGGLADKVKVDLALPELVKSFRIAVPSFCKDIDILEAGTVSEGTFDAARRDGAIDGRYLVNNGAGLRITGVVATLNGPVGQSCAIPVYIVKGL